MTEHPAELVERVLMAIWNVTPTLTTTEREKVARAALEAIRPAEAPDWHEQFKAIIVQGLRARGWQTSNAEKFVADAEHLVMQANKGPVVVPEQEKKP